MVYEIPDLADQLAASIEQMADHGELHALASKLPFREYRTAEFLNRQPVVADRFDVMTVVQRLQVAGELAAAVAVDLDQSMPVTIELQQPGGLAAYEARAAAARIDPHAALVQQVTDSGYARQVADGMHAEISEAAPLISAPIPTKPSRPVDPTRTSSSQPSRKLEQERHRSDRQSPASPRPRPSAQPARTMRWVIALGSTRHGAG
jgi:hypothetical protein